MSVQMVKTVKASFVATMNVNLVHGEEVGYIQTFQNWTRTPESFFQHRSYYLTLYTGLDIFTYEDSHCEDCLYLNQFDKQS